MSWITSRIAVTCGGCSLRIASGAPIRRLRTGSIRCAACAKRLLGEDVPATVDASTPPTPAVPVARGTQPFVTLQSLIEPLRRRLASRVVVDHKRRAGHDD